MNDDIEVLKAMIEPLKDWKFWEYSCTDEDIKKAMENKSYIEVVLEEQSKTIKELQQELQRKDNIINELKESINNFDVFKEFTFPLMKRDEEQQVISSIDYEWRKSIKEPFLDKIKELEGNDEDRKCS